MPRQNLIGAALFMFLIAGLAAAQEPVTIALREQAVVGRRCVCLGDVATLTGGTEALRRGLAALDIDDLPPEGRTRACSRAQVAYRLRLAQVPARLYSLTGSNEVLIVPQRRPLTAARVEESAREALTRHVGAAQLSHAAKLVQPISATLPAVADDDQVVLEAQPNGRVAATGRVQMNVTIRVNGERRLTLPVFFELAQAEEPSQVRVGETVRMTVRLGSVNVVALGEALQGGRHGDLIRVRNLESKKVLAGRVSGPKTVDIDAGMTQETRRD